MRWWGAWQLPKAHPAPAGAPRTPGRRRGRGQVTGFPPDTVPGEEGSKFGVGQSQVDVPRGSCPRGLLSCGGGGPHSAPWRHWGARGSGDMGTVSFQRGHSATPCKTGGLSRQSPALQEGR